VVRRIREIAGTASALKSTTVLTPYDNDGIVGFSDFGAFATNFGTTNELYNHTEPVTDVVGFADFGFFSQAFGGVPGPSGTTAGTIACP